MVKAVIFDLDDTLISEEEYIESGYRHIARILRDKLKITEEIILKELMDLYKQSPKNVFNRMLDKHDVVYTKEMILELVIEYRNHYPKVKFYEDVLPCIVNLKTKNIKVGIITDGYAKAQSQKLLAIKAYDYFDEIILTDELGHEYWKPHPKSFEIIRDKLDVEFDEMIYVGDNPEKDFYISKTYPIKTIRINRAGVYQEKEYLEGIKENYSIYSLIEIKSLVDTFQKNRM